MHVLPNFSLLITKICTKLSKLCLVGSVLIVNTARRYNAVFNKNMVYLIQRHISDIGILHITTADEVFLS